MREVHTDEELVNVLKSKPFVVVDTYIPRCGPCAMLAPLLESMSIMMSGVTFVKANLSNAALSKFKNANNITRFPTIAYVVHGEVKEVTVGADIQDILETMVTYYKMVYDV